MPSDGFEWHQGPATAASEFNGLTFLVESILARVSTATLVKVVSCTNDGGLSAVGFVDIKPLVKQVDGAGRSIRHATIFRCPYLRVQGGANAIIVDPQVGDIGIAVFADRDISSASKTKDEANPGSARRFSMADGLYLGGVLNGVPAQYVRFSADGIEVHSPDQVKITAPDVVIEAATLVVSASASVAITTPSFTVNGASQFNGAVVGSTSVSAPTVAAGTSLTVATKEMAGHTHGGVQTGIGTSGPPS